MSEKYGQVEALLYGATGQLQNGQQRNEALFQRGQSWYKDYLQEEVYKDDNPAEKCKLCSRKERCTEDPRTCKGPYIDDSLYIR